VRDEVAYLWGDEVAESPGARVRHGVVLDTPSEGPDSLFVPIETVFVPIVTKYT